MKEVWGFKFDGLEAVPDVRPRGLEGIYAYAGSRLNGIVWVDPLDAWI
jgi:hypothetical protein